MRLQKSTLSLLKLIIFSLIVITAATAVGYAGGKKQLGKLKQPGLWQKVDETSVPARGRRLLHPNKFSTFQLEGTLLSETLSALPLERSDAAAERPLVIEIPMPDGSVQHFRVEDSQVFAPHLAAAFPTWKTIQGYGVEDSSATARFDWSKAGFHGYIFTDRGTIYIDPFQEGDTENYVVYYKQDFGDPTSGDFSCGVGESLASQIAPLVNDRPDAPAFAFGNGIRTYRLAIATTGEWARSTTSSLDPQTIRTAALAALMTSVNRLDGIYRRELGVSFQLVNPSITNNATNIIFDDPATDPYDNSDSSNPPNDQLAINQTTVDARVGAANYDIGHLYGTGGGGVASSPSVCGTAKAQGYSARAGFLGDPFTVDYVAHEIGHQFGAAHTYNNQDNGGACTTRSNTDAFEVASGSTLMSYVGICNIRNLQQYVDVGTPAFHIRSLTQMVKSIQDNTEAGGCGTASGTNNIPTVNPGTNYTIPRLTPFTLTASGADADPSDVPNLRYSWEEYDLAPSGTGQVGTPALSYDVDSDGILRPLFRAYSPVASPSRTFPSTAFILNPANNVPAGSNTPPLTYQGTHPTDAPGAKCQTGSDCVVGENLPTVARTMNFRVAVRDSRGGIADAGMTVTVAANTGPFQITAQNTAAAWAAGTTQTVTWDVAGTNVAPISATNVKISLSTDGGQTFSTTLLASTPNDGSEPITVPNTPTGQARIKVEAVGNIFFDINNVNFTITGTAPAIGIGDVAKTESAGPRLNGEKPTATVSFDFPVTRSGSTAAAATVHYQTVDGTATVADHDYEPASGNLTFDIGETTKSISVIVDSDDSIEPDETFDVILSAPAGAIITDSDGVGTILNDDVPQSALTGFSSATYVDDESQSAVITLTRTGDLTGASSVTVSTVAGGTATGGAACLAGQGPDFTTISQTVTFAAGSATPTQPVLIPLCSDLSFEGDETVKLALSNPVNTAFAVVTSAVLTINDTANQYLNTTPINLNLGLPADPYPSTITVANSPASVFRIRVTLYDLSHTFPDNIKVLLVGPNGAKYILMADAGGPTPISPNAPVTLTFTDGVAVVLPDSGPLTRGKFLPTSWGPVGDFFPPAPSGPYVLPGSTVARPTSQTLYGNFGQVSGNGVWSLYVRDDNGGLRPISASSPSVATGSIAGGWGLELLASTASGVSVSGRVTTPDGQGLRNAQVTITDSHGTERTVITSSFGYYNIDDVEAGGTYVIGVSSKRYRFDARFLQVSDSLSDVNFVGSGQ